MAGIRFQGSGVRGAAWGAYGVRALAPAFRRRRQAAALQIGAPGAPPQRGLAGSQLGNSFQVLPEEAGRVVGEAD